MTSAKSRPPQSIGINYDSKCNARCGHCCVNSSPEASDSLTDAQVDQIVSEALEIDEIREIGFTGGEPLLRQQRLLDLMKRVTDSGRSVTLVTNAFWAVTPSAAERVVSRLLAAGLRSMTISYDDFHSPYVKPARVRNALDAASASDMDVILNMAVSRSNDSLALLRELGDSTLGIRVTRFPIIPSGQAANLEGKEFIRHARRPSDLRCPGFELIFHNDGNAYPCCSPAVFDTGLRLGRVSDDSVAGFISRIERNILLAIIQREGFGWFLTRLKPHGTDDPGANFTDVVSACEVCLHLFKDRTIVEQLGDEIREYADRHLIRAP